MRVLLPAPFSPSRACTSPGSTSKHTREFATTPGKHLTMSFITTWGRVDLSVSSSSGILAIFEKAHAALRGGGPDSLPP